jgi:hypothetical protein
VDAAAVRQGAVLALLSAEAAVQLRAEVAVVESPRRAEAAVVVSPRRAEAAVVVSPRRAEAAVVESLCARTHPRLSSIPGGLNCTTPDFL